MKHTRRPLLPGLVLVFALAGVASHVATAATTTATAATASTDLQVTGVVPLQNSSAPVYTAIWVTFDRPIATGSITPARFRVFGRSSGAASGNFSFSNGDRTVTFTPTQPFSAGEIVTVNLSHDILGADLSPLRAAGFAWQFMILTFQSPRQFEEIDVMSNRIQNQQTRIYGASSSR
jgi:hypothetical protein